MAKLLNQQQTAKISLLFDANTSAAQKELQSLSNQLTMLSKTTNLNLGLEEDIADASRAAAELSVHLKQALNTKTGTLDFTKLNQSIKQSGSSLQEYSTKLQQLGPAGQQAFLTLTKAVASAEIPMRRTSALVSDLWNTLKNTARWQISSSILHGFMGTLQSAYGYAQDLNESLNNIRIVTGANVDEMARFAEEANKAAKALNTTTTAYTNASLIYFQQGLSDQQVKERTDITIKMANVARQSAETVSNQMTAVWNNFYDGSKSLEYYADVMTALGAATASSTEEISAGLEKFAGIADTVGLSFDYAASALATVTATSRESADVVGTAFKTLFARIQDLELGKTLDDGTTLGKYSEALRSVGIDIKDASGQLKNMDSILEELGGKWKTLSKDTQVALAQTVAGTRQYTQLMTLMNNWDFMQSNLTTSKTSKGALQQQANIYADSWEAASKRVKAAAEEIFAEILDDKMFIGALNGIASLIEGVDHLIDRMGGLTGVVSTLGMVLTRVFSQQLSQGLTNIAHNMKMMTSWGKEAEKRAQEKVIQDAIDSVPASTEFTTDVEKAEKSNIKSQLELQQVYTANAEKMSVLEQETNKMMIERVHLLREQVVELNKQKEAAASTVDELQNKLKVDVAEYNLANPGATHDPADLKTYLADLTKSVELQDKAEASLARLQTGGEKAFQSVKEALGADTELDGTAKAAIEAAQNVDELKVALEEMGNAARDSQAKAQHNIRNMVSPEAAKSVDELTEATRKRAAAQREATEADKQATQAQEDTTKRIKEATGAQKTWADTLVASANAAMALVSAFNQIGSLVETLQDPHVEIWEKFTSVLTTLAMLIPTLITLWAALNTITKTATGVDLTAAIVKFFKARASKKAADAAREEAGATAQATEEQVKNTAADSADIVVEKVKKGKGKGNQIFKGSKGDRWFSNKYDKQGHPLDQNGQIIGKENYAKAGLDANGKKIKAPKTGGAGKGKIAQTFSKAFPKSGTGVGASAGAMAAAVAVAAAVVITAVVAINKLNEAYDKNELAAQRAEAAALNLGQAYSDAKAKSEELNNTISNYSSARDGLQDLVRGTAEFANQLAEANDEALKLLDSYGDIIGNRYTVDSDGLIKIDEDALEEVKKLEADKALTAQGASIIANQEARDARIKADTTKLNREKIKSTEGFTGEDANRTGVIAAGGAAAGAVGGLALGAALGSAVPVIGTLIGAGIGLLAGAIGGGIAYGVSKNSETDAETAAIQRLGEEYSKKGASAVTDEEIQKLGEAEGWSQDLIDQLKNNSEEVKKLCSEMAANTAATNAENMAMAGQILADNETVQNSQYKDDIAVFAGATYGKVNNEAYDKYMGDDYKANWLGIGKQGQKDAWAKYAESQGLSDLKNYKVTNYKKDGSVVYSYTDEDGKKQKKTVSQEEWAAVLAAQEAEKETNDAGVEIAKILDKLDQSAVKMLSGAKSGDMSGASMGELLNSDITKQFEKLSYEDLLALGFSGDNKEDILKQIEDQRDAQIDNIKLHAQTYGDSVKGLMDSIISDNSTALQNVTQGTLKAYADTLSKINLSGGSAVMEQFNTGLDGLMGQYADKADQIMGLANNIDWSKGEAAMQDFNYQLLQMGINVDESSAEWQNMLNAMQNMNTSVVHRDLDSIRAQIVEINNIAQNVEMGSIISDEDYQTLLKYNAALADQFAMTADGMMYVGGADLDAEAKDAALKQLQQTKDDNKAAIDAYNALNAWGWSDGKGNWTKEDWYGLANGMDSDTTLTSMSQALIDNEGKHLNALGKDTGALQEAINILNTTDGTVSDEQKKVAREQLQSLYKEVLSLNQNYKEGLYEDTKAEEVYASTLTSIDDLKKAQRDNYISRDTYNKYIKVLVRQELQNAKDLDALDKAYTAGGSVGKSANLEAYRENLQRLGEGYSTAAEELEAYQQAIESNDKKAIRVAENTLKNAIKLGEAAAEYGVNAEELEKLTMELTNDSRMGFNAAMQTAIGYMTLAEELGISVEELQNTLATLTASFDGLRAADIDALFTQISEKAKELGLSVTELAEQVASLGTQFGVSGEDALEMATLFTQANSDLGVSNDELIIQTQNIASEFGLSAKAAAKLAVENQRMNKGVAALTENWQDWKNTLKTADKTSTDYAKAMGELTQVVRDLTGAGDDFVMTSEFLEENMELIEQAANGDAKAINLLGVATAKATVSAMAFDAELMESMREAASRTGDFSAFNNMSRSFEQNKAIVQSGINDLMDAVANGTIKVGDSMSVLGNDWIDALNEMALQTGMSVEEMNSLLNQMGVSADVTVTEVPTMTRVPVYRTEEQVIPDESGQGLKITETKTSVARYEDMEGTIQVASVNADANVTYTGNGSVSTSSKTSGGGSTSKPAKAEKKQTKERYTKVTEQLDDTANAMGDANREMDTLYGAGRIAKMSQVNKLLGDEVKLLEAKTKEAKAYLVEDKKAMENAFKDAGVKNLEFDANGNVSNIESILDGLDAEYNKLVADYNSKAKNAWDNDNVISGNEQKELDALKERMDAKGAEIDAAKAAYDQYADTLNVIAETEDQILEKQNEVRANNYQKMVDNLNLALEGTTAETQEIDYYLNKIADDFYKMSEAAALTESKMGVATEVLALQKQHADGLASAYAKGNITQADYVAGLGETRDAIYGELESLQSLDKEMQDYYGNTLSAAGEELDKYTERMDHLNSVLDHYQSLLGIIGQETDYKAMGIVLQGIADGAENSLAVAKAEYAFYAGEAEKKKALMESVPKDSAAFEQYKKEWEAAEAASREAQDNMLSATAEWAEAMKSVLTNELSDFASTLEKQLTGGTSFDEMTTSIERAASLQEDYLTTTNQIYETTKMMRVAEKALDETTSTAAKNKLKGFLESTKQLQNQEKLSKFELDMQQKKYDLLLAEIALEEAQNAKSTVRLQRDAEGNFGYVYTADANQVADAQQKVDDAENALYNAGLEGANDFAQKQAQIAQQGKDAMQELTDALANGEITFEEWERRTAETQAYYTQKLKDYSELYQVAISADSAIMQESWATDFTTMIADAETWSTSMDEYLTSCAGSFAKWQETVDEVQNVVGSNYTEIADNVGEITDANDELTSEILDEGGVLDTLGAEVDAVSGVTEAYALKRQAILDLITANEEYIKSINAVIAAESGKATVGNTTDNVPKVTTTTTTESIASCDTGGYTGEWGPSGKLAVLHQKELVLNATDTANLLSVVDMIRALDMHAMSAQIGGILSTPGFHGGESGSLEQNVKIEASFPNVQDRNEIEEAFNNLINRASQYANRG